MPKDASSFAYMVKTKIICTIGPASSSETTLRKMMLAGMDVARLNFSHGSHAEHLRRINTIRRLNRKYRRHIRILQDLEGYRIRIGRFKDAREIVLKRRQVVFLTTQHVLGEKNIIPFDYRGSLKEIKTGACLYIDDGSIALCVKSRSKNFLKAEVLVGGVLRERKGVNIPGARLSFDNVTGKDKEDIAFGIEQEVDYVAQSFVRNKFDVLRVRRLVEKRRPGCKIIAKIENRQGINNISEIIEVSDGIMIARGDMGVSIPIYEVPIVQKEIIRECNRARRFVITATQMLESMTENVRPTRAEVTDVANAIIDGTDFVMLSAETAAGMHPVEAVTMMNDIIKFTEKSGERR